MKLITIYYVAIHSDVCTPKKIILCFSQNCLCELLSMRVGVYLYGHLHE